MSYVLIQTSHAPYSTSASVDAIEAAMAATNVGLKVKYLFIDDGVYQLLASQQPKYIDHKNMFKRLSALPFFDIDDLYVRTASLEQRKIDLSSVDIEISCVDDLEISRLCEHATQVLVF